MKFKFGKTAVENPLRETVDLLRAENRGLLEREGRLKSENANWAATTRMAVAAARFKEAVARLDFPEERMAEAFGAVDEGNALWVAVLTFLDKQAALERDGVCAPGLSDEGAHYNRGRLAMAVDLKDALVQVWASQRVSDK